MTTDEDRIAFYSRPIDIADVLAGVRYGAAFDRKGTHVGDKRAARRCQRRMKSIASSCGHKARSDGAVSIHPVSRALEHRRARMNLVISRWCEACLLRREAECTGAVGPVAPGI